ncbi:alpha/beta hydrolase [Dyella jiangningensis]|uniref:alpha/beta hydrolase n=1 Tax=Dyella jiangningensis TaxID=1379159 RepID=UPI00240F2F54|nr:alpha/beta hydrolase [Dyella jiangningensis]MDG2537995.1 alpha/beta hydrolase [Dyella jiangningensis]
MNNWRRAGWLLCLMAFTASAGASEVLRDLPYGDAHAQRLDVYRPERAHDAPIIVMVHGGAWMFGDKANAAVVHPKAAHWESTGYVFVSVDNRLWPDADPLEQAKDVATALAYVQHHAREWGGDPSRVVLIGHSAGAHLVALLDASPRLAEQQGARRWLGTVSLDAGAIDVPALMGAPHANFYDRVFGHDPGYWRSASPFDQLSRDAPPLLLVCSSRRMASCPHNHAFAERAKTLGVQATVIEVPLSHGDINATLGAPGDYTGRVDAFLHGLGLP